jgi:hypothetical protein
MSYRGHLGERGVGNKQSEVARQSVSQEPLSNGPPRPVIGRSSILLVGRKCRNPPTGEQAIAALKKACSLTIRLGPFLSPTIRGLPHLMASP